MQWLKTTVRGLITDVFLWIPLIVRGMCSAIGETGKNITEEIRRECKAFRGQR